MIVPSWVPGQETKPAPMPLLLVQSFVNTWDGDDGSDLLLDPAAARDWLTDAGLWSAERAPDPAELHLARGVREAIRAMLVANAAAPGPDPAICSPCRPPRGPPGPRCRSGRAGRSASVPSPPATCSPCCWQSATRSATAPGSG